MIDKLKQWASDNNKSDWDVCRELGVPPPTYKRWLKGTKPSSAWVILINAFLTQEGVK